MFRQGDTHSKLADRSKEKSVNGQTVKQNQKKLLELDPEMQEHVVTILQLAAKEFPEFDWTIASGKRTKKEQAELYAKGPSVTKAKPGQSRHEPGLAVDIYPMTKKGIPSYKEAKQAYDYLGNLAGEFGLLWGGAFDWKGPKGDYGHIEIRKGGEKITVNKRYFGEKKEGR